MLVPDDTITPDTTHELTSGGERKGLEAAPVLCISKALALKLYDVELERFLADVSAWRYVDKPVVDKWHMTTMDAKGTHRVSEVRYSVTAKVGVKTASREMG